MFYLVEVKSFTTFLLAIMLLSSFFQPNRFDEVRNRSQRFLDHNRRDSVKVLAMEMKELIHDKEDMVSNAIADYYLSEGILYEDPEQSLSLSLSALQVFKRQQKWKYAIRALKSAGNGYKLTYEYDSATSSFEEGLLIMDMEKVKDIKLKALLNYGLGASLRESSDYQEAISCLQKAIDLSESERDSAILISASIQTAAIFFEIENYSKSKEYFMLARRMANSSGFENFRYFVDNGLAHVFKVKNQLDSALLLFQSAYTNAIVAGDEVNASVYLFNIADLLLSLNELDSASLINKQMMEISDRLGLRENLAFGYEIDSRIFSREGKHEMAVSSAEKSLKISKEIGDPEQLSNAYKNLHRIYKKSGKYSDALEAFIRHDQISDSLLSSQNIQIVEELETKYKTEKKDRSIEQLTQQNQIQNLEISKQRLWLFVSVIGIAGLILLVLVFYILNKKRLAVQAKESEDLRQKLLRIQLNPHFTYNSLNAIQSMIYEDKDKQKTADYLSSFSSLMRNILELNQHDYITLEEELDFIENYIEVQQMRFDNPIHYHLDVGESLSLEELLIPPMITQPFLENSFEHGFPDKSKGGELWIKIGKEQEWLAITIKDNGVGLKLSGEKEKSHNSLATKITEERLYSISSLFKKESGISIRDFNDEGDTQGTEVNIKLPLIYD